MNDHIMFSSQCPAAKIINLKAGLIVVLLLVCFATKTKVSASSNYYFYSSNQTQAWNLCFSEVRSPFNPKLMTEITSKFESYCLKGGVVIIGDEQFTKNVISSIYSTGTFYKTGSKIVGWQLRSKKTIVIVQALRYGFIPPEYYNAMWRSSFQADYWVLPLDLSDYINPLDGRIASRKGEIESLLAHEFHHALQAELEPMEILCTTGNCETILDFAASEIPAIEIENCIREQAGLPLTQTYDSLEVFGKGVKKSEKFGRTHILVDKNNYMKDPLNFIQLDFEFFKVRKNRVSSYDQCWFRFWDKTIVAKSYTHLYILD